MSGTFAFVGVTGGAGTTRLSLECAAALARAGDSVAVLDAAVGTQGQARYVEGRIDPDLTAVLTDEAGFAEAGVDVWQVLDGRTTLWPAHAPFERLARAKSRAAARQFENCIARARDRYDHVLVDVPPVADNQALAAVTAADERVLVAPDTRRGADSLAPMRGRLVDVGVAADALVANRVEESEPVHLPEADHAVPEGDPDVATPQSVDPDSEFAAAVGDAASGLFGRAIEVEPPSDGLLENAGL